MGISARSLQVSWSAGGVTSDGDMSGGSWHVSGPLGSVTSSGGISAGSLQVSWSAGGVTSDGVTSDGDMSGGSGTSQDH